MKVRRPSVYRVSGFLCVFFILPFCFLAEVFAGSPFYLTVERSFSTTEKPQLRLDYTETDKPIHLRVLQPKNLETFLDGQLQISRSYEEPTSELNPGHYLVQGLNKTRSPLKAFRAMLDPAFRSGFAGTALSETIVETPKRMLLTPPEEVIQGPPSGFTVVRDYFIDLQYGGTATNDLGWWFASSTWDEGRYQIRTLTLDPLPDGVYLVQAVQGKAEGQCLMQVSSLSVQVKQSTEQLVVRVIDRQLHPIGGAAVSYRDGRGRWIPLSQKTNASGEISFVNPEGILDGKLVVKVETPDGRKALTDTDFLPTVSKDDPVFMITDRPIFKPGETLFYKGIIRTFDQGQLKVPAFKDTNAKIHLVRTDGKTTDVDETVALTPFGSFSGELHLDPLQTPGLYRLIAEIEKKPYGGEFRVRDYVKPKFYLELIDRSPLIVPGEQFSVKFKARRYSGGSPAAVKYEVFLYRKKFEAPEWVVEAGGGLSAGTDYWGEVRTTSALTEPQRIFSSAESRLAGDNALASNTWDTAPQMDGSGEETFTFDLPKMTGGKESVKEDSPDDEWIYTLMVRAMDSAGSTAILTENIFVTRSEALPLLRFSTNTARVGEKGLALLLRSTYADGKPAPGASGVVDLFLEKGKDTSEPIGKIPFVTDEQGQFQYALPESSQTGRMRAVATLETLDGKGMRHPAASEPALLVIGGNDGAPVFEAEGLQLYTSKTILSVGEKAEVLAVLPAGWGQQESGTVWETIAGTRVHETKATAVQGRSRWFSIEAKPEYGTGFYQTIGIPTTGGHYDEKTLGFRIIPDSKRLQIGISPEKEEAAPLKPFQIAFTVKDANGAPAPDTELAVTIVDRAVYAVQQEIRPGIFDFFYPLPRLNVATFYSDELQGYGYADLLKKPNFKLGALKSQSKITKKSMRDTAGWFPHVMTDKDGLATISVDLPANVTEWLITAVAADTLGRVGEEKKQFRTHSDVTVEVLAPQFLRKGDTATLNVQSVNHLERSVLASTTIAITGPDVPKTEPIGENLTLKAKGEHLQPLQFTAAGDTGVAEVAVALKTVENLMVAGSEVFELPLKPASMRQEYGSIPQNGSFITAIPEAATVRSLRVDVLTGLLGAAINSAGVLVAYPHGCIEQLVHSTVPNLVLMNLVRTAGILPGQLGPLAQSLLQAEKNAALGINNIIKKQKADGGFGLWQTDSESSLSVTLTALYALKFATDLKIEGADIALNRGLTWLSNKMNTQGRKNRRDVDLSPYELSRLAEIGAPVQPWEEQIALVKRLAQTSAPAPMHLVYGLRIIKAYEHQDWNRFNQAFKNNKIREKLIGKLKEFLQPVESLNQRMLQTKDQQFFDRLGFGYGLSSVVSAVLGVLDDQNALSPELKMQLSRILLDDMKNGYWTSTFDTAQVIFATRGLLAKEAAAASGEKSSRTLTVSSRDGHSLGTLERIPKGFTGVFVNPGPSGDLAEIHIEGLLPGEIVYSHMAADVPFEAVKPAGNGITVARKLFRVTSSGHEELHPDSPLHKGDTVVSEVTIKRDAVSGNGFPQSRFVVVEDGLPSFSLTIDNDESLLEDAKLKPAAANYWSSIKDTERYADKTVRIAEIAPGSELQVCQVWQIAFSGEAALPPALAFDMYDESVR
ncbi:MAG: MG2 domain-containing protein, partial [Pseudomonadota bacterium]